RCDSPAGQRAMAALRGLTGARRQKPGSPTSPARNNITHTRAKRTRRQRERGCRMSTPSWVPAMVAIGEDMGPYAARILADQRWNGWVVPRFTREVAQQVVADLNAINTAAINTGEDVDPFEAELARFDGDDILIIQAPGTDE